MRATRFTRRFIRNTLLRGDEDNRVPRKERINPNTRRPKARTKGMKPVVQSLAL